MTSPALLKRIREWLDSHSFTADSQLAAESILEAILEADGECPQAGSAGHHTYRNGRCVFCNAQEAPDAE